ncbi:bacteriophage Gp15 protein [Oribacterium sp. oral taxon 078 str. F0263]|uniref:bacteriophage Gp15 family protein n=1 Tax=Oribacterium sp. oral taxon 078 TaxID=652706 RepID=UPI0003ADAD3E|nr:bacteriophage Gp15 family protein [Oribacterium sp. oral taxon 078]ERL19818.1 bacteriophage Gp15 protein [Oribacterium sp. oral taxon 078 str. F0263]
MNLLIDGLPDSIEIEGRMIPIKTSFRTGILFEQMILDQSMDDLEKIETMLGLYIPGQSLNTEAAIMEAVEKITWFYRCGADPDETIGGDGPEEVQPFNYEIDADYIYAAFRQAYNIDLAENELHWWQFRALFKSLPETTQFMKIIGFRTVKISNKFSKEQKQYYERMKRLYKLPESKNRQQLESDLATILMNGGSPAALLDQ